MPRPASSDLVGDRSLKLDVYASIVAQIHRGELRPGDRVSEADVAARLGISRAPVREAFAQLVHEGLIVRKPRSGSFITRLSQKDLEDIRDARILIECHAARRASTRITADDADELRALIATMAETAARAHQWTEAASLNARFHQTVARIADNRILERLWRSLDPLAWLLAPAALPHIAHDATELVTRHELLLEALLSGDPARAAMAFKAHILDAAQRTAGLFAAPTDDISETPASEFSERGSEVMQDRVATI
jgi:DNA-binding GntR family transcriptional regulator